MASSAGHFGGCLKVDIPRLAMIARLDAEETAVVDVDMDMCIAIRAIAQADKRICDGHRARCKIDDDRTPTELR